MPYHSSNFGLGFRVWGLGLRVEGLGYRVQGFEFRIPEHLKLSQRSFLVSYFPFPPMIVCPCLFAAT